MGHDPRMTADGPFRAEHIRPGDRYELSRGHAIYRAPTGGDGARGTGVGFEVLDTDPAVDSAGIDAGYSNEPGSLRAPDIAVGNVPDQRGWLKGAPPLAVEYASVGQDEDELQAKIQELLEIGTRHIWVVRLTGPRRVEVHEPGAEPVSRGPGQLLSAPGVLKNEVPVEALYDREVAHELTLRNLLQRRGYDDLGAVRAEGREEGREEGRDAGLLAGTRAALLLIAETRGLELADEARARIEACTDLDQLRAWMGRATSAESQGEVFGSEP